jgi:GNAT superfamily N-acetyltransferase
MAGPGEGEAAAGVSVVPAGPGEMATLVGLVLEMLAFYGTPPPLPEPELAEALERDGPAGSGAFECLVARPSTSPAPEGALGFAMFSTVYEAGFAGNGVFLRDIYVTEPARGQGVGKALMVALARYCTEKGYRRIDWHADRLDLHARTFYELIAPDSFKLNRLSYRIEGEEIGRLAVR